MVRTIVFVVLRIRAVAAGLGAMLGLGRWTKKSSSSNQSLFSSAGGKKKAAAGKSRGRRATAFSRLFRKRTATLLVVMLFVLAMGFRSAGTPAVTEVPMSTFMQLMEGKRGADVVESVRVSKTGTMFFKMNGKECYTLPLRVSKEVFKALCNSGIPFRASKSPPGLSFIFPVVYLLAVYYFIVKRGQGSMVGSTGKLASSTELDTSLTFGDVAGVDQAKSQVQELVSMIKNPAPFIAAGARLPSGLLMVGPPGTGKTLMARVMAAEAGVPLPPPRRFRGVGGYLLIGRLPKFYYCSGSDFVEMYVGRGAARVRKLFVKAGKTAPCIIFLDELDALGKERSGTGGRQTNDEAEQTLNQLLACMDGLDTNNNGVMVIAATNRYDVLDNALTRPGRFDRIVRVDVPDAAGREAILKVHTRKMKLEDVDVLRAVAELTPGLAGAELATIANEAAISAARRGSQQLLETDFLESVTNFYVSRKKGVAGLQNMFKGMLT
ncbi:cell division protein [Ectocarpus siliculosus]|uniref:Cell division protein n=1 Tax=Ectocarpus siliculosus TaxID=2880 RepID=D7G2Q1_ECTSI|nr:cell division protein [Ectocarpus siliculosus]|eukprot:CBJ26876.1 cell division protein [Ectocarpus siliculosus]